MFSNNGIYIFFIFPQTNSKDLKLFFPTEPCLGKLIVVPVVELPINIFIFQNTCSYSHQDG